MGVKLLGSFISKHCEGAASNDSLLKLRGKRLVIDASNCIYRFLPENTLIPSMYEFCATLKFYEIKLVFVFDGKSPIQKRDIVIERQKERERAKLKYEELIQQPNASLSELKVTMRKMIRMTSKHVSTVKELLDSLGIPYIDAKKEADEICVELVRNGQAYACVSGDTDMFLYGCPRVIRYLSIRNHTCIMYDLDKILNSLNLSFNEFREICIVAGTDYSKTHHNLYMIHNLWQKYITSGKEHSFCDWLFLKASIVFKDDMEQIIKIYTIDKSAEYQLDDRSLEYNKLQSILSSHNFINLDSTSI
jgi:flap endonuclease-1